MKRGNRKNLLHRKTKKKKPRIQSSINAFITQKKHEVNEEENEEENEEKNESQTPPKIQVLNEANSGLRRSTRN